MRPGTEDHDLARALSVLHRQVALRYGAGAREAGLTLQQAELLCQLEHSTPSFGELARLLGCDKTNVTGMVDRLERRGLVRRAPDPADRRVSRVTLTDEGREAGRRLRETFAGVVAEKCATLSASDRDTLARLGSAAARALEERR
ncbi:MULTISPECIES: MarR family winged helix-turn-helix transcriptional regulator [Streptomyces]|uniref:MarR family winged helix-turn-helix transcriptional regulator n=1 Tax=Streptomyces eurythermus TaxID=42237 RepID=A0ABW6YV18_9ACTN|nr:MULTISPECIES: MarR family transcriptional regulator [Streptomyces]QIS71691.1 MarR family transcriptional regulator [Streptomyces sp. DSM 40868]WDM15906.1 MarR family transcriptional regulator [Streptomyces lavenduligriseus]